jgi:hypothetical protein
MDSRLDLFVSSLRLNIHEEHNQGSFSLPVERANFSFFHNSSTRSPPCMHGCMRAN